MGRFAGKTIVVTGSGKDKGLGQGILRRFADEGANCVVSDLKIDAEAEAVAEDLRARGAKVATIACDVSDALQCQALVDQAVSALGSVDVFVNNAGIGFMMKPMLEVDPQDWATVIAVNLSGAFYCTQAAAKAMIKAGKGGRIINIASQAAKTGFPHLPAYVSSKHGMVGLTRATAVELGAHGITVNALAPGFFPSKMTKGTLEHFGVERLASAAPLNRIGDDDDLKGAALLFASAAGKHITGQILAVDGGVSAVNGG